MSRIRWTAVPARRLSGRDLNLRVNLVIAVVLFAAVAGPAAMLLSLRQPEISLPPFQVDDSAALAQQVAIDFVSGQYTSVPVAVGVDPTFGAPRVGGRVDPGYRRPPLSQVASALVLSRESRFYGAQRYELIVVRVVGRDGSSWDVSVAVYPDGPALAAAPSLLPAPRSPASALRALDYRADTNLVAPPQPVIELVAEWAGAWASGDSQTLKRLTGDTQPGLYRGLGGFVAERTVIVSAVAISRDPATSTPDRLILRVTVWLAGGSANLYGQSVELDLLVVDANSDLPKAVSWGPPGSAPSVSFLNREPLG